MNLIAAMVTKLYIRQTGRYFKTTFDEHLPRIKNINTTISSYAEHLIDKTQLQQCTEQDDHFT